MNTKTLYTKDKAVKITFRCDNVLSDWVIGRAEEIGLTPSAFVRQILYQQFYGEKTLGKLAEQIKVNSDKAASAETAVTNGSNC